MAFLYEAIASLAMVLAVFVSPAIGAYTITPGSSTGFSGLGAGDATQQSILRQIHDEDSRVAEILDSIQAGSFGKHNTSPLPMNYNIFRGKSSLRSLSRDDRELLFSLILPSSKSERVAKAIDENENENEKNSRSQTQRNAALNRVLALLFLLKENLEVAHELVLGVTLDELETAEYAATHPGKTSWLRDHPLDDSADWIHAIVHRLEGSALGEVDQPGYENAKYWILGGPKLLERPAADHPVRKLMARCAPRIAPVCVSTRGLLWSSSSSSSGNNKDKDNTNTNTKTNDDPKTNDHASRRRNKHRVLAGGGKFRSVVPPLTEGEWDDLAFIELYRQMEEQGEEQDNMGDGNGTTTATRPRLSEIECAEIMDLQRFEILCLLHFGLQEAASNADC
mmetsp:Transcript_17474/g.48244  ORF Transcript_17474/g.48244 Transcript_17474/m.48244 type:complete len:395 (+) Transcript_17474:831-2015(+)